MSSRIEKVMSLGDKVRIIRKYEASSPDNLSDMLAFRRKYAKILMNRTKILAQYDDMKAKLAAVRDLVITEYGKPNYIAEKHAFLQKIMIEWYRRAVKRISKVSVALVCHKADIAMRILNITGLPMSETQICALKRNCHEASLQRNSKFESTTLCMREIAQELLQAMGISKETAITMYGPNIYEEGPDDDEDDVDFVRRFYVGNQLGKRKLKQKKRTSDKSPKTSNEKHVWGLDCGMEVDLMELNQCESEEEEAGHSNGNLGPSEPEVKEENESEEEDFELYDVISVVDSAEDDDAATSTQNIIPDSLIKKECETSLDNEAVVPCSLIKVESDEGQSAEEYTIDAFAVINVQEKVEERLIKKECETTDDEGDNQQANLEPSCSIKIENETLDEYTHKCDAMATTIYLQDCVKQETEEANNDDEDGSVQLFTVTREDRSSDFNADGATPSMKKRRCVDSDQDAMRTLELLKGYLQQQRNGRALEALAKVKAAFPQSAKKSS